MARVQEQAAQTCAGNIETQNQGIRDLAETLRAAIAQADAARDAAKVERQSFEQRSQAILKETTPAGMDACKAASAALDAELRKERGE